MHSPIDTKTVTAAHALAYTQSHTHTHTENGDPINLLISIFMGSKLKTFLHTVYF
jgi:hypothetical protein